MNLKKTSSAILFSSIKLVIYAVVIISVYLLMSKAFTYGAMVFSEEGMTQKGAGVEVQITIPKGASNKEIGDILEKNGLVENAYIFWLQVILYEGELKSGKFVLNTEYNAEEIINALEKEAISDSQDEIEKQTENQTDSKVEEQTEKE